MLYIATIGENNASRISTINDNDEGFCLFPIKLAKTHSSRLLFKNNNLPRATFL